MKYAAQETTDFSAKNEGFFRTLDDLYHTSRLMLGKKNTATLEEVRQLAASVTQVRVLLAELEHHETRLHSSGTAFSPIPGLKQRYLELEGMVKEARNTIHDKMRFQQPPSGHCTGECRHSESN